MILDPENATLLVAAVANKAPNINPDDHLVVGDRVSVPNPTILGFFGFRVHATVDGFYNKSHRVSIVYDDKSRGAVPRKRVRKISST